jgi:DNA recombination protein RmuC
MDNSIIIALLTTCIFFVLVGLVVLLKIKGAMYRQLCTETERLERSLRDELARSRNESIDTIGNLRKDVSGQLLQFADVTQKRLAENSALLSTQLDNFSAQIVRTSASTVEQMELSRRSFDERMEAVRVDLNQRLKDLQEENSKKLSEMRETVDEKLHATLEKRLGESFKIVGERLEAVARGLGEMQTLASNVGDLKNILSNVRTRGTFGEIQLGAIIEQMLTPDQFVRNFSPEGGKDFVEFAVKFPRRDDTGGHVYLPIDSKFPVEAYQRMLDASQNGDLAGIASAQKELDVSLRSEAKRISGKYVKPPETTDFAVMFLPTEGLYAEALRLPGLAERLQQENQVTLAGPTTLAALLSSLRMGFRTLAIQQRSLDVWKLLGSFKLEFARFGKSLDDVKKRLEQATSSIDDTSRRTAKIQTKLDQVQTSLPEGNEESDGVLPEEIE